MKSEKKLQDAIREMDWITPRTVYQVGDVWFQAKMFRMLLSATNGDVIMPMLVEDSELMQEEKENGMYFLEK